MLVSNRRLHLQRRHSVSRPSSSSSYRAAMALASSRGVWSSARWSSRSKRIGRGVAGSAPPLLAARTIRRRDLRRSDQEREQDPQDGTDDDYDVREQHDLLGSHLPRERLRFMEPSIRFRHRIPMVNPTGRVDTESSTASRCTVRGGREPIFVGIGDFVPAPRSSIERLSSRSGLIRKGNPERADGRGHMGSFRE